RLASIRVGAWSDFLRQADFFSLGEACSCAATQALSSVAGLGTWGGLGGSGGAVALDGAGAAATVDSRRAMLSNTKLRSDRKKPGDCPGTSVRTEIAGVPLAYIPNCRLRNAVLTSGIRSTRNAQIPNGKPTRNA